MRVKGPLSKTPGVILERSEIRILHAARSLEASVRGVLQGDVAANKLINEAIRDYQKELDAEAAKAGAGAEKGGKA